MKKSRPGGKGFSAILCQLRENLYAYFFREISDLSHVIVYFRTKIPFHSFFNFHYLSSLEV